MLNSLISTIETARLTLRPMLPSDVDGLLPIFSDAKVMASFGAVIFDHAQMGGWVQRNLDHQEAHGYGLFAVILKANNLLIGDCGLEVMEVDGTTVAELGYDFRSDYWNRGYATEAATAVRDFAFQTLGLPQLISLIRVGNVASKRVAEKVGMQCVEEIARYGRHYWKYSITRELTHSYGNE
jgi:ribosomal-protein-alanine N-acetyltransferase